MHHALAVEERGVGVAVDVEVSPAEVAESGHAGKRTLPLPRAVCVVAQHRRRPGGRTEDHVEISVHLDVGRPHPIGTANRGILPRQRRHQYLCETVDCFIPQPESDPSRSRQHQVHPVVAVPVEGEHAVGGRRRRPRRTRPGRKRETGAAVRVAETARLLPVRHKDHRGVLSARHHRHHRLIAGYTGVDRLGDVGEALVPRRSRGGRRGQHEEAHQRLGDGLGADADPGLVLPERGQPHEDVAQELGRPLGSDQVPLVDRRRQSFELGDGEIRPAADHPLQALDGVGEGRRVLPAGRHPRVLHEDREVAGPAVADRLKLGLGLGRLGIAAGPVELLGEGVPGPQVVGIELHHLPVPRDGLLETALEAGELGLQEAHLGAVGGEAAGRLDVPGGRRLVAETDVHHREVGPDRGLVRGQRRRPLERRLGVVEQPDLEGGQAPVERAHGLAVLGRYLRRDAGGHAPAADETQGERGTARREGSRCSCSHHRPGRSPGRRRAASCKTMPRRHDNRDARRRRRVGAGETAGVARLRGRKPAGCRDNPG